MGDFAVSHLTFRRSHHFLENVGKRGSWTGYKEINRKDMAGPRNVIGEARYHSHLIVENSEQLRAGGMSSLFQTNTERANGAVLEIGVQIV
jgi:hypothetical protein